MIALTSSTLRPVTRELAVEINTLPSWGGERPLKPERVEFLESRIQQGLFRTPEWAIAHMKSTGITYRVNGQHSSFVLASVAAIPAGLNVLIDRFEVDDLADVGRLFAQFDRRESARSFRDLVGAECATTPELESLNRNAVAKVVGGISCWISEGGTKRKPSVDEVVATIRGERQFVAFARPFIHSKLLAKSPVIAAMFGTYKASGGAGYCEHFWRLVAQDAHPSKTHPSSLLHRELLSRPVTRGATNPPRAVMVRCINAWNAFVKNVEVQQLRYHASGPVPAVLHRLPSDAVMPVLAEIIDNPRPFTRSLQMRQAGDQVVA